MRHQLGTTLLELLIVLCLITIITSLSVVSFIQCRSQNACRLSHMQLMQTLTFAMQAAIFKREDIGICYLNDINQCSADVSSRLLIFIDRQHLGRVEFPEQRLRQWQIPEGTRLLFRSYPSYRHYLLFTSSLMQRNDNATLWYCDRQQHAVWAVILSQSGRMITRYPTADGTLRDREGKVLQCGRDHTDR